jgi:hypothetical protein
MNSNSPLANNPAARALRARPAQPFGANAPSRGRVLLIVVSTEPCAVEPYAVTSAVTSECRAPKSGNRRQRRPVVTAKLHINELNNQLNIDEPCLTHMPDGAYSGINARRSRVQTRISRRFSQQQVARIECNEIREQPRGPTRISRCSIRATCSSFRDAGKAAGSESIFTDSGYGFRARSFGPPRNDGFLKIERRHFRTQITRRTD